MKLNIQHQLTFIVLFCNALSVLAQQRTEDITLLVEPIDTDAISICKQGEQWAPGSKMVVITLGEDPEKVDMVLMTAVMTRGGQSAAESDVYTQIEFDGNDFEAVTALAQRMSAAVATYIGGEPVIPSLEG